MHSFNFSAEYRFTPKSVIWLTGWGYGDGSRSEQNATFGLYDDARILLDHYDRLNDSDYGWGSRDFAVGFKHSIVPQRHELIIDVRRFISGNDGEIFTQKFSRLDPGFPLLEVRSSDMDNNSPGTTVRMDYNRPWGPRGRIAVGLMATRNEIDNASLNQLSLDTLLAPTEQIRTHYTYDEQFSAAYSTVAQTFGKLGVQLGLRWEITETDFQLRTTQQSFGRSYNSVFPTLNMTWDAGRGRTIRLNVSKRIMRPYPDILNPFIPVTDPLNIATGNPDLRAAYTHSLGLDLSRTGTRWTFRVAPSLRRTTGNWEQIREVDSLGVSRTTWHNSRSTTVIGSTLTASLRPLGRLSGSASFSATHTIMDAHNISADLRRRASTRLSLGGNASGKITSTLTGMIHGTFVPAYEMAQGSRSASFMSSISLRQQLLNNRAVVQLSANDPLDLYRYRYETRDRTHVQTNRTVPRQRVATVSFTWNFGKPPEQNSRAAESTQPAAPVIIR
jgi:hypothetical protein